MGIGTRSNRRSNHNRRLSFSTLRLALWETNYVHLQIFGVRQTSGILSTGAPLPKAESHRIFSEGADFR